MINANYWPKAVYRPDQQTLIFYCDDIDHTAEGITFAVPDYVAGFHRQIPLDEFMNFCINNVPWTSYTEIALNAVSVVITESFRCYRPHYCTG